MRIEAFVWLAEIEEKLLVKHAVSIDEAEDAVRRNRLVKFVEKGSRVGEDVYAAYGRTEFGRYLIVFFIAKANRTALIIGARDMNRRERRAYEQGK